MENTFNNTEKTGNINIVVDNSKLYPLSRTF